jgi:uncharacterized protein YcbK (DUF882 family)
MQQDKKITQHFSLSEFRCKCGCGGVNEAAATALALALENTRLHYGPILIASGFRCPAYNAAVGGKPGSMHLLGLAADIPVYSDSDRFRLLDALLYSFDRIGIGKSIVHADIGAPHGVAWTYP